jgi:hypothetical protein
METALPSQSLSGFDMSQASTLTDTRDRMSRASTLTDTRDRMSQASTVTDRRSVISNPALYTPNGGLQVPGSVVDMASPRNYDPAMDSALPPEVVRASLDALRAERAPTTERMTATPSDYGRQEFFPEEPPNRPAVQNAPGTFNFSPYSDRPNRPTRRTAYEALGSGGQRPRPAPQFAGLNPPVTPLSSLNDSVSVASTPSLGSSVVSEMTRGSSAAGLSTPSSTMGRAPGNMFMARDVESPASNYHEHQD